jgi:type IV secretory pathway VirB10-like protein
VTMYVMTRVLLIPCACLLMSCDQKPTASRETPAPKPPVQTPPTDAPKTPKAPKESPAESFIGLTTKEAMDKAAQEQRRARIAEEDGEGRMLTRDFIPNRLNFFIKNGRVIRVTLG